ncbi:MAG TPA: hypothetical protein VEZ11_10825 [Thermoanaerobaculia bacterium]|nr:hypothetical protein [Thermoanaerobaculia bacterium]
MATFINRGPAAVEVTNPELTSFLNISATDGTELDVPASDKFRDFFDDPPHTPRAPLKMSLEPGKALRVPIVVTEVLAPGSGYIRKQMDGGATGTTGIGAPSAEEIAAGKLKWPPRRIPLAPGTYTVSVHVGLLPADTDLIPGRFLDSETVRVKLGSNAP